MYRMETDISDSTTPNVVCELQLENENRHSWSIPPLGTVLQHGAGFQVKYCLVRIIWHYIFSLCNFIGQMKQLIIDTVSLNFYLFSSGSELSSQLEIGVRRHESAQILSHRNVMNYHQTSRTMETETTDIGLCVGENEKIVTVYAQFLPHEMPLMRECAQSSS